MSECEVCRGESGGTFKGVASIPGVPMSIGWCDSCLTQNAVPRWVVHSQYAMVGGELADWFTEQTTWVDGAYQVVRNYIAANKERLDAEAEDFMREMAEVYGDDDLG